MNYRAPDIKAYRKVLTALKLRPVEGKEKGVATQVVHLDLAGPLPESKEGYEYILGITDNFSAFVMAIAIKGKTHEEVMEAFANNWTYRIGPPEYLRQ